MAYSKAVGILHLRTLLQAKGDKIENAFLEQLSQEEQHQYHDAGPATELPLERIMHMIETAVPLIYTGSELHDSLHQFGRDNVRLVLRGLDKFLLSLVTPLFFIKQGPKLWKTYHRQGKIVVESDRANQLVVRLTDCADLPPLFCHVITGMIQGLTEATRARQVHISPTCGAQEQREWTVTWE